VYNAKKPRSLSQLLGFRKVKISAIVVKCTPSEDLITSGDNLNDVLRHPKINFKKKAV